MFLFFSTRVIFKSLFRGCSFLLGAASDINRAAHVSFVILYTGIEDEFYASLINKARGWSHPERLQHPEGVDPALGAAPSRRHANLREDLDG